MQALRSLWLCLLVASIGGGCANRPDLHRPSSASVEQTISPPVDLFEVHSGFAVDYRSVRIPSLAKNNDGTLLCWVVGRQTASDWSPMDMLLSRSHDGGRSWSKPEIFIRGDGHVVDNATNIVADGGRTIHFLYQRDYARLLYRVSHDGGKTFSDERDITGSLETARKTFNYNWSVLAPGPGAGAQLKSGRLLSPVWLCNSGTKSHRPSVITTVYSDDNGKTWNVGDLVVNNTEQTPNPSESIVVQLPDGRVMLNGRCESKQYRRLVSYSLDGATGWTPPELVPELYDPICHASLVVVPPRGKRTQSVLAFVNPDSRKQTNTIRAWGGRPRENLTLHLSLDNGKTWPILRELDPERVAYSAMTVNDDGTIALVFERGYLPGNDFDLRYFSSVVIDIDRVLDESAKQ